MLRRFLAPVLVLGFAALVRLPHYDVTMFAADQVSLMAQARRVLAGHWDVIGPDAAGLNIVGPLYAYLLAGLLWLRNDPGIVGLFGVSCDVLATWFVYDTARRVSGEWPAIAAAATYALAPVLALSTRIIWNPSLLPALVAVGWWLVVRYCQSPSTAKLLALALVIGLTPTLHATGVFHGAAMFVAVVIARPPSLRQFVACGVVGILPLLPVLPRLVGTTSDVGALGTRVAIMDLMPTLTGVAQITLGFPLAVIGPHWTATMSSAVSCVQAVVAAVGVAAGLVRRTVFWPLWLGLGVAFVLNVASAFIYGGYLSWYYFMALTPGLCLGVAHAVDGLPRFHVQMATAMMALAATHLVFLNQFDGPPLESGVISLSAPKLMLRMPASGPPIHFPTLRDLNIVGSALHGLVPDGATAMLAAHGSRGELWRETGAEFLPPAGAPREGWPTEFLLMGPGATVLESGARLIDGRVCVFERPTISWRAHHRPQAGWEQPGFVDEDWVLLGLPRRIARPSLAGANTMLAAWRAPQVALRGRFTVAPDNRRHIFAMTVRSAGNSQHWITSLLVNGTAVAPSKERVMYSVFARTHEWLIDVSTLVQPGSNVIALALDGQMPQFDLDVFEVPCLDSEWYY